MLITYGKHITYGPPHTVAKFPGVCARLKSVLCEDGWLVSSLKIVVARTPRNMVSDGSRAGGVCRTPGRECLSWPMPPYYYIVLVSRIRGASYV